METINFNEAKEDARRLTKVTKREVEVKPVSCDCDYDKSCGRCAGDGTYFQLVYGSCDHVVQDGPDETCESQDCAHKEYLKSIEREEQLEVINS